MRARRSISFHCALIALSKAHVVSSSDDCGLFLAPSTIEGAGLGVFVGNTTYAPGDLIGNGDILIPIMDLDWNNLLTGIDDFFLWDEYAWSAESGEGISEEVNNDFYEPSIVASPGFGALPNSYGCLNQVSRGSSEILRQLKSRSPGAGAVSPYQDFGFQVKKRINAGAEVFVRNRRAHYVAHYHTAAGDNALPEANDYRRADGLILKIQMLEQMLRMPTNRAQRQSSSPEQLKNRMGSSRTAKVIDGIWKLLLGQTEIWPSSQILRLLSSNRTEACALLQAGGMKRADFLKRHRDVAWLQEHGQCLDNIKRNASSVPDAGRGAFASRFLPSGCVVAPAPLIHIPDRNILKIFRPDEGDKSGPTLPDVNGPWLYQLLVNYCFGHERSSLLLCPYGMQTAYINHSSQNPNAKIQWNANMRHAEWLQMPIDAWGNTEHAGLAFDIVALRDIQKDEEILIHYGTSWVKAWADHIQSFTPRASHAPAYELNQRTDLEYRTIEDTPYELDGVELWCRGWFLQKYFGPGSMQIGDGVRCQILKFDGNDEFTIQLMDYRESKKNGRTHVTHGKVVWGVPRSSFYFRDMPDSRDHLQFGAFRHPMMIPDEFFPDVWSNLT